MRRLERLSVAELNFPHEVAVGEKQSRLGKVVTDLFDDPACAVDFGGVSAGDEAFLRAWVKNPLFGILIARYTWAPTASFNRRKLKSFDDKDLDMSQLRELYTTIHNGLGAASGSLIYSESPLRFDAIRTLFSVSKTRVVTCGVSDKVHAAIKSLFAQMDLVGDHISLKEGNIADHPFDVYEVEFGPNHERVRHVALGTSRLLKVVITLNIQGDTVEKDFYAVVNGPEGVSRKADFHSADKIGSRGGFRRDEMPIVSSQRKSAAAPAPAAEPVVKQAPIRKGATLAAHLSPELKKQLRESSRPAPREYPTFEEPERDDGRPRKRGGNKKKSKDSSRNEGRYK